MRSGCARPNPPGRLATRALPVTTRRSSENAPMERNEGERPFPSRSPSRANRTHEGHAISRTAEWRRALPLAPAPRLAYYFDWHGLKGLKGAVLVSRGDGARGQIALS